MAENADNRIATSFFSEDETSTIALLRVMATMGVLSIHIGGCVTLPGIWGQIASCGADGVKAYFLLTGYLVMHSWQSRSSTKDYWRKRLGRTLPIYYTWLAVLIVFRYEWITADPFAIPRALLMLEYLAPPTMSYSYCSMSLLGVMTIFMMFYLAIPFIAKWVKSLNGAFICFWVITAVSIKLPNLYAALYNSFCNPNDVATMAGYLAASLPYFGAGILIYFGKKDQEIEKLLFYLVFIAAAGSIYPFLGLSRVGGLVVLLGVLLCYPLRFSESLNFVQQGNEANMTKMGGGAQLFVQIRQPWCGSLCFTIFLLWLRRRVLRLYELGKEALCFIDVLPALCRGIFPLPFC